MDDAPHDPAQESQADAPLEPALRAAAHEYHRPPDPPVEAMWRAIQAERRAGRPGRPAPLRWVPWAAAALLAVGVGIGRLTPFRSPDAPAAGMAAGPAAPLVNATAYRLAAVEYL
ncbi:MAG: hypothetical protein ABIY46_16210, partial [Gemmatimonadales bacterium]